MLLSHSTWVLVRDAIACVPKGEISVKGIPNPVKVYEEAAPYAEAELPPAAVPAAVRVWHA